ncbi:unnamed protein product, partial [Porites evermanni]
SWAAEPGNKVDRWSIAHVTSFPRPLNQSERNYPQIVAASALNFGLVFWFHLFQNGGFISPRWFPPSFQGIMGSSAFSNLSWYHFRWLRQEQFLTLPFLSSFQVVLQDSFQGDVITMVSSWPVDKQCCRNGESSPKGGGVYGGSPQCKLVVHRIAELKAGIFF